jgi:NADH-quinone oxidoreductase subunit M
VFVALDFFLFYIFWEVMLLPMYFLIGVWGGARREYAAIKFFLFTLAGSVLMLVGLVAMYFFSAEAVQQYPELAASVYRPGEVLTGGTFDIIELSTNPAIQKYFSAASTVFLAWKFAPVMFVFLFVGFAIKLPSVPVHTWLPDAHVEAPTPISMILAGVLLKMGGYGFLRLCYPIFPTAGEAFALPLATIGVISILYGALCAMAQTDFKKLVAYSSVSHMGYVLLGIAVMTPTGFQGAMFQMIAHGISSPMCFFLVGSFTTGPTIVRSIASAGCGCPCPSTARWPPWDFSHRWACPDCAGSSARCTCCWAPSRPGTSIPGLTPWRSLAAFGVVLTAGYILWVIQRVYLGKVRDEYKDFPEATGRELLILAPMGVLCIVLGILPKQTLFDFMNGTLDLMLKHMDTAQHVAASGFLTGM